ncbi:MAG: Cupin domain protein [Syntrophorhabdaceae bacterium PtaU1.Bin034]|nr:MAG: Cupin domain protein [Syntrophorhabdaceae bacterium PtaU1.Bin034]
MTKGLPGAEVRRSSEGETIFEADGAVGKRIYGKHGCEYVRLTIRPGSGIAPHRLGIPVTFMVLSGTGLLKCNNESYRVEKGDMAEIDPDVEREWSNEGPDELALLVIRHG